MKHIRLPLTEADIAALQAGDEGLLSGPLYTARDAAHQRLCRCLQEGKPLPVELAGETIYYVGPSPAKPGEVIGSAGPTTSYRMDPNTPPLLALGLKGMIGKGRRSAEVVQAIREHGAVYFITIGGAAALLAALLLVVVKSSFIRTAKTLFRLCAVVITLVVFYCAAKGHGASQSQRTQFQASTHRHSVWVAPQHKATAGHAKKTGINPFVCSWSSLDV